MACAHARNALWLTAMMSLFDFLRRLLIIYYTLLGICSSFCTIVSLLLCYDDDSSKILFERNVSGVHEFLNSLFFSIVNLVVSLRVCVCPCTMYVIDLYKHVAMEKLNDFHSVFCVFLNFRYEIMDKNTFDNNNFFLIFQYDKQFRN